MTEELHFIGKVAQKAIIEREGKILLARDPRDPDIFWELPGGRLNQGELPEEGLQREIREELGVEINPKQIFATGTFEHAGSGGWHLTLVYLAELVDPNAPFTLQEGEVAETKWIDASQLYGQKIYADHLKALEKYFNVGK